MTTKRQIAGGLWATVGYLLSPLSWWNDAFVNFPLALGFAWLVSALWPADGRDRVFGIAVVAGYWLTNVLGFVLLHHGMKEFFAAGTSGTTRRQLIHSLGISLGYTALVVVLIKLGVLEPLQSYLVRP
jgi:hypothetical protein